MGELCLPFGTDKKGVHSDAHALLIFADLIFRVNPKATTGKNDESPLNAALKSLGPFGDFDTEIFDILLKATEDELSDEMKLQVLLSAMYQDEEYGDKDKAMARFCEVLSTLSPELVSS